MTRVSCIIPAYNEETRIGHVLEAVAGHPLIDEIIVVDDGSKDDTSAEARAFSSAKLIVQENAGKSAAIAAGIRASSGELLLFLDADLVGLSPKSVTALMRPVLDGKADIAISLRRDALPPWRMIGLDYLSGERLMSRSLVAGKIDAIAHLSGYGLETYLNELILESAARVGIVWWPDVGHTYKVRKYGMLRGIFGEVRMLANIIVTISLIGTARQIIVLYRRRLRF